VILGYTILAVVIIAVGIGITDREKMSSRDYVVLAALGVFWPVVVLGLILYILVNKLLE
jgi:Na+/H+-dicarboxylate symporter